jgi:hypothetical protein
MELFPESLAMADQHEVYGFLPLHMVSANPQSTVELALMLIEKYPAALHLASNGRGLPLHVECVFRCRSSIISRCIELYPEAAMAQDINGDIPWSLALSRNHNIDLDELRKSLSIRQSGILLSSISSIQS